MAQECRICGWAGDNIYSLKGTEALNEAVDLYQVNLVILNRSHLYLDRQFSLGGKK